MHQYSSTQTLSPFFYVLLSTLSILSAWLLHFFLAALELQNLWWIELPSVLGFYAIFWRWFDEQGWKTKFLRKLFRIATPDISGTWSARADTLLNNQSHTVSAMASIKQTWTKIRISIDWEHSTSSSLSASLHETSDEEFDLIYHYLNTPKPLAPATMNIHRGTAWLSLSSDAKKMEGEYYSGRGRNRYGQLVLSRDKQR